MGTLSEQPPSGATRSLTEVFILLRNNAIQSKHIFAESRYSGKHEDRMSLVPLHDQQDRDIEASYPRVSRIPPEWVNMVDEIQYEMCRVTKRIRELKDMQQKHLMRPSFSDDGSSHEEKAIEAATQEITRMLMHCHRLVQHIQGEKSSPSRRSDTSLLTNVINAELQALQSLTVEFRTSQTAYLKQVQSREDSFQQYFEAFSADGPSSSKAKSTKTQSALDFALMDLQNSPEQLSGDGTGGHMSMAQLQSLEENSAMIEEREKEILHVTKSIVELNHLFKDLASFVVDQGTVVDRIDYNIEQSSLRVSQGLKSVKKADQYHKKNRKMICILVLSFTVVCMLVLLILVKS